MLRCAFDRAAHRNRRTIPDALSQVWDTFRLRDGKRENFAVDGSPFEAQPSAIVMSEAVDVPRGGSVANGRFQAEGSASPCGRESLALSSKQCGPHEPEQIRMTLTLYRLLAVVLPTMLLFVALGLSDSPQPDKPAVPAAMPEAKTVSLQANRIPFQRALAELVKQTGIRVEDARGASEDTIELDWKQTPFWPALDALAAAGKARVRLYPSSGRIVLDRRGENYREPPRCYDGRFRMRVKNVTASRDLEGGEGSTHFGLEVAWDPELLPLYLETRPRKLRWTDDRDKTHSIPDDGNTLAPVDGLIALAIDLRLPAFPRSSTMLRSLQGELSAIGPNKMLTFTFNRLDRLANSKLNDPERNPRQENVTCRILDVKILPDRWTVRLALEYPSGMKQLDTSQSWVVNNEMTLESPDGTKRIAASNYVVESSHSQRAVLSYHFRDRALVTRGKPEAWRVRYRTPANLIEIPIAFTFHDVPLP